MSDGTDFKAAVNGSRETIFITLASIFPFNELMLNNKMTVPRRYSIYIILSLSLDISLIKKFLMWH